jgi:hypothetical protein
MVPQMALPVASLVLATPAVVLVAHPDDSLVPAKMVRTLRYSIIPVFHVFLSIFIAFFKNNGSDVAIGYITTCPTASDSFVGAVAHHDEYIVTPTIQPLLPLSRCCSSK